ncbi:methylglutaconyl-CoA hydratase, mitochondrial [Cimex lectularius]|uniref:Methylglutaconyl-CoA hydratase n=1 Tax=Cimex lectularius TaxID=79782 RepID=A0A8I6RPP3_CIMLE|nr:methylglutaconyl-CoA hydratase, mitochondrial [Cimex lectularius]
MFFRKSITRLMSVVKNSRRFVSVESEKHSDLKVELLSGSDRGIMVLGLDRLKGKNSFSKSFVQSLEDILEAVRYDKDVRALVLRSHVPGVFCAGADLKERLQMTQTEVQMFVFRLRKLMVTLENTPVPVIAAINGAALGGGLEMALACDIRVATDKAKIGLVETKLAIIPGAGGTQRLTRIIGPSRAKELIFTARVLSGSQAQEYGIVNHCVESKDGEDAAFEKALSIAREIIPNGPIGVKMAKQAISKGIEVDLASGFAIEELCYAQVIPTKDRLEGLKAFQEKRTPVYTGS